MESIERKQSFKNLQQAFATQTFYGLKATFRKEPISSSIPLYSSRVAAGNPSTVEDLIEKYIDLNH